MGARHGVMPTSAHTHFGPWPPDKKTADQVGSRFYFTGKACANGHTDLRSAVQHTCLLCARASIAAYRATDVGRERQLAAHHNWVNQRPEEWWEKERERKRVDAARRRRLPSSNDKRKRYRRKNRVAESAYMAARRARILNSTGHHTAQDIDRIYRAQNHKCAYCQKKLKLGEFHVDHIIPLKLGGSNDARNIQITCAPCNARKGAKDPITFAAQMGLLV